MPTPKGVLKYWFETPFQSRDLIKNVGKFGVGNLPWRIISREFVNDSYPRIFSLGYGPETNKNPNGPKTKEKFVSAFDPVELTNSKMFFRVNESVPFVYNGFVIL